SNYGFVPVIDEDSKIIGIVNRASLVEYIADQIGE
ncbi:MAG: CBS domain-containing protein, partial [Niallia sp.]